MTYDSRFCCTGASPAPTLISIGGAIGGVFTWFDGPDGSSPGRTGRGNTLIGIVIVACRGSVSASSTTSKVIAAGPA